MSIRNNTLSIILLIGIISCNSSFRYNNSEGDLVEKVLNNELPDNFEKFQKKELLLINHGDTLVEKSYEFVIPKGFKSYQYSYTSIPATTTFTYTKNQKIIVVKPIKTIKDTVILELDAKEFENTLESLRLMSSSLEYTLKDVLVRRVNSKYGVVTSNNILILQINFLENSPESKNFELLSRLDR